MGYARALEAAGFTVHEYKSFGCYQGTWVAIVSKDDGPREVVRDHFGSCTLCDAFQSDMGFSDEGDDDYDARLKAFGERYTALPLVVEYMNLARRADEDGYINDDDGEALAFIAEHAREVLA